jgi:hypothetical protein
MADFGFHVNRKAKRGIRGPFKNGIEAPRRDGDYVLFEYTGDGLPPRHSDEHERGWQPVSSDDAAVSLPHEEAWRWLRGEVKPGDAVVPSLDEMLDVIARKLREENAITIESALDSPERLFYIYRAALRGDKLTRPVW